MELGAHHLIYMGYLAERAEKPLLVHTLVKMGRYIQSDLQMSLVETVMHGQELLNHWTGPEMERPEEREEPLGLGN